MCANKVLMRDILVSRMVIRLDVKDWNDNIS